MIASLREAADRRPIAFTLALGAAVVSFLLIRHRFGPPLSYATVLPGEALLLAAVLGLVGLLGWWRRAGVSGGVRADWALAILAAAAGYYLLLGSGAFFLYRVAAAGFVLAGLVGAAEEILCRGVVLGALMPLGRLWAAAGSAIFFGVLHLGNLLLVPSPAVVAQAAYAVLLGLLFAAARLRVGSIWPVALVHAAIDLPGLAAGRFLPQPLPNPWLGLVPVALTLPWAAVGIAILVYDELRRP